MSGIILWHDLDEIEDEEIDDLYDEDELENVDLELLDEDLDGMYIVCLECGTVIEDGLQCQECGFINEYIKPTLKGL